MGTETNGVAMAAVPSALVRAEEFVQQQDAIRDELLRERAGHLAVIERIDAMLARLPGSTSATRPAAMPSARPVKPTLPTGRTDTIPGLLMAIIGASPGITSKEMIPAAQKQRKGLQPRDVFANLYRLEHKRRLIRTEGVKGSKQYYLVGPGEEATSA